MGIDLESAPDSFKRRINRKDRPKGKVGRTFAEAEADRVFELEIQLHNQFWSFLRRNDFEDVEYSNPRKPTRARKGRPDFLVCRGDRRLGIEFKIKPNKLSPDQIEFFKMAKRQGNACVICYTYASATKSMEEFFNSESNSESIY